MGYDGSVIAHLKGTVLRRSDHALILAVGGVGYRVYTTTELLSRFHEGDACALFTHLSVRETALELFGFAEEHEVRLFELLLGVSGVGPRSALSIMNLAPAAALAAAIARGDTSYLTKVSGIGKKSAQKIVVELKDKLGALPDGAGSDTEGDGDVIDALTALGYSLAEAREALARVPDSATTTEARVRAALKALGSPHRG